MTPEDLEALRLKERRRALLVGVAFGGFITFMLTTATVNGASWLDRTFGPSTAYCMHQALALERLTQECTRPPS